MFTPYAVFAAGVFMGYVTIWWWHNWSRAVQGKSGLRSGLLAALDGGHPTDAYIEDFEAAQKEADGPIPVIGDEATAYLRWAARLACEFKLEFGIPKRTEANRMMVRDVLYKKLKAKNTRYAHMRAVLPITVDMCFLKDQSDLEVERLMQSPDIVRRAQQSVVPYWSQPSWIAWVAKRCLPDSVFAALGWAFPGYFNVIPGFSN
jgi:hypothetical protein